MQHARIKEALDILQQLDMPREQRNERSALTLLALAGLTPETPWPKASAPLVGITQMMDYFRDHFGKNYKPNTRETVRRQTVHQFEQACLVVSNPDKPERPINSPHWCYQLTEPALALLRKYDTRKWGKALAVFKAQYGSLQMTYAQAREIRKIPVKLKGGQRLSLSPGGQNELVKRIVEEFCSRFIPGGEFIYVGDTDEKFAYFNRQLLASLGLSFDEHGKFPDLVVLDAKKQWLFLIEAVTSHGPVSPKRYRELANLFSDSTCGLVYVTAFPNKTALKKFLTDISWETEVWVADNPDHMIHFDGERFLGPYGKPQ